MYVTHLYFLSFEHFDIVLPVFEFLLQRLDLLLQGHHDRLEHRRIMLRLPYTVTSWSANGS